jgi:8-oxo-dGTP pyrophosphatase MutT (NUDIX family)
MRSTSFSAVELKMHPYFNGDAFEHFSQQVMPALLPALSPERGDSQELRLLLLKKESTLRSTLPAHLTTSSVVLSPDGRQVLLLFHKKIGEWVYPGGHADGDWHLLRSALRECFEETGLERVEVLPPRHIPDPRVAIYCPHLFHRFVIKPNSRDPEHIHFDSVFVFRAHSKKADFDPEESDDLCWVDLEVLQEHSLRQDRSIVGGIDALTARICLSAMQSALGSV